MAYKTILVYVDEAERCGALMHLARRVAETFDGHVIGLHVVPNIQIYAAAEAQMPAEVYSAQQRHNEELAAAAKDGFGSAFGDAACSHEWLSVVEGGHTIAERVLEHGLTADLIVTGQIDPDIGSRRRVGTPEHVLIHGGRPLLMVPYVGTYDHVGRHVLLAWNSTGEAARAAFDALPFLKAAERVTILSVDAHERPELEDVASAAHLAKSLARHGVEAKVKETQSGEIGIGATLLNAVAEEDHDLLVMGGYGHSRLTEFLFGGATRSVLQQMTLPVLIAH